MNSCAIDQIDLGGRDLINRIQCIMVAASLTLSGCGTYVPNIQEFPGDRIDRQQFVSSIVSNINCELRDAVNSLYDKRAADILNGWGIQTTLTLSIDEKSELNPTLNWMPPGQPTDLFNLAGGINTSAKAIRENKINSFYLVKDFLSHPCSAEARTNGLFLMQSDLKLGEWLFDAYTASTTNTAQFSGVKDSVLTHHLTFEINSSGNITPAWKLTRIEANQGANLFSASRNRTQDLIITLGPAEEHKKIISSGTRQRTVVISAGPSNRSELQHYSSVIGSAVAQGVRSAFQP